MEIRSYRTVFDLERRIYRVDRLRLNPAGIPVRGMVYCLAILAALAVLAALPLVGAAVRALPWYLRDLALPVGSAGVLTMVRVEGRPFHLAAAAQLRHALGARRYAGVRPSGALFVPGARCAAGGRWRPEELLVLPDGSDARLRRLRYTGPGAVVVRVAHERADRRRGVFGRMSGRPHLTLREPPGGCGSTGGEVIALERGVRMRVR